MEASTNKNLKQCKSCGKEMAKSATSCPHCGAKNGKPIFKRVWFWAAILILIPIIYVNVTSPSKEYATIIETNESVSGYDLIKLNDDNPYNYTELYRGKTVKVVATINDIWKQGTLNGRQHGPMLELSGKWLVEVQPNDAVLPSLHDGDEVEIVGTINDVFNDYIWTTNAVLTKSK